MKQDTKEIQMKALIAFALIVGCFFYFQCFVPYHLYFKEQIQLFIFSFGYFLSYFGKPGGLACLSGDFLTQFLYLKGGGAVVISLLLLVKWLLVSKTLNLLGTKTLTPLLALFPVIAEWIFFSEISFSIAMSMAFLFPLLFFRLYTCIRNSVFSIISGILLVPILYFLAGSAMLLFPALVLIYDINNGKKQLLYWLILFVLAGIFPYLVHSHFLLTVKQAYFYPFPTIKNGLSVFTLVGIAFLCCFRTIRECENTIFSFSFTMILALIFAIGGLVITTNSTREKILGMASEAYFENWNKVLEMGEKTKLQNPISTYYTNIALSKQMQMGDRLMTFYQPFTSGLFLPVKPESSWFSIFFSSDAYFYTGDMNMAQHSAMLGMIFSPYQRSSRLMRRLVEINVINDDVPAATKYLRILEATWFHKKQAVRMKKMLLAPNPEEYPELQEKRSRIHKNDILRSSQDPKASLELLVKNNPDNRPALDYLLSYYLLNKDIPHFFETYTRYYKDKNAFVPKMYAEALLIYFAATHAKPAKITDYKISTNLVNDFNEYTQLYESSQGDLEPVRKQFADTYWLYYHFATLKE
ncbi:hypothetical protein FACS189426_20130 [Bacteroidia bacterium]|nr:hypothetical protein FACS189426_20130 [Bacteroidia bacterium]GHV70220.1 hypothetical protein FACS189420_0410 [Bacteroidia bacterium]